MNNKINNYLLCTKQLLTHKNRPKLWGLNPVNMFKKKFQINKINLNFKF